MYPRKYERFASADLPFILICVRVCERKSKREAGRNREGVRDKEKSRERKCEFEIFSP